MLRGLEFSMTWLEVRSRILVCVCEGFRSISCSSRSSVTRLLSYDLTESWVLITRSAWAVEVTIGSAHAGT